MSERLKATKFRSEYRSWKEECTVMTIMDARNTHKKPYDDWIVDTGHFIGIEHKLVKGLSINGNILKDHQVEGLMGASRDGSGGLVNVFLDHKEYRGMSFCCSVHEWLVIFYGDNDSGIFEWGQSCKIKDLIERFPNNFIKRIKAPVKTKDGIKMGTVWNFKHMWEYILCIPHMDGSYDI